VLAGKQVERALEQAIAELEPMYREVLLLRDAEGLTAPEVAEVLRLTPQAVKSRLHRARLSVRARVAPLLGIPTDGPAAPGTGPEAVTMFSQKVEDMIGPELCTQLEQHLEACDRCRGCCETLKQTLALCRTSGATTEVPSSVQATLRAALRTCLTETA